MRRVIVHFLHPCYPLLAEQKRIVAKVEALLTLCDALAAGVVQAEEVRGRALLDDTGSLLVQHIPDSTPGKLQNPGGHISVCAVRV